MSPGIGMPELLVVLVLALVVVGPQQLPVMMRRVGQLMNQARGLAKEFQNSFEEIGRETELAELRKEIEALKQANPVNQIKGELDKVAKEAQAEPPAKTGATGLPVEDATPRPAVKSDRIDG
ncbi:MAG: twin-arginine translocase subunit TatB [Maricaulis sp.]|nr:twin-arginine translocase subunit TatB [Maricaulis sp.]